MDRSPLTQSPLTQQNVELRFSKDPEELWSWKVNFPNLWNKQNSNKQPVNSEKFLFVAHKVTKWGMKREEKNREEQTK